MIKLINESESKDEIVMYLDPMHQIHNNESGYMWQLRGKKGTKIIKTNTGRRRLNILGALNPISLETVIVTTEANCNQYSLSMFLLEIRKNYLNCGKINIFLDNARYNHSKLVKKTAEKLNINLIYLPPYSPNLNLIERLWKFFKKVIVKNKYYSSFELFSDKIFDFFKNIDNYSEELKKLITLNFEIIKYD